LTTKRQLFTSNLKSLQTQSLTMNGVAKSVQLLKPITIRRYLGWCLLQLS